MGSRHGRQYLDCVAPRGGLCTQHQEAPPAAQLNDFDRLPGAHGLRGHAGLGSHSRRQQQIGKSARVCTTKASAKMPAGVFGLYQVGSRYVMMGERAPSVLVTSREGVMGRWTVRNRGKLALSDTHPGGRETRGGSSKGRDGVADCFVSLTVATLKDSLMRICGL